VRALKSLSSNIILQVGKQEKQSGLTSSAPVSYSSPLTLSEADTVHDIYGPGQTEPNQQLLCWLSPYLSRWLQSMGGRCRRAAQPTGATLVAQALPRAARSWLRSGRDAGDVGVLPDLDSIFPDLYSWGKKSIQKSILVDFKWSTKLSHLQSQWIYSRMIPTKKYTGFPCKEISGKHSITYPIS